jgi:hypothetical protein
MGKVQCSDEVRPGPKHRAHPDVPSAHVPTRLTFQPRNELPDSLSSGFIYRSFLRLYIMDSISLVLSD